MDVCPRRRLAAPGGPRQHPHGRERHPVVHVAHADVEAYLGWAGKTLPTEAEWEFAARGGLEGAMYAWGSEFTRRGRHLANTWQGEFPHQNLRNDGYEGTSPVGSFPPNGYGLYDMIGNVWEWTDGLVPAARRCGGCLLHRGPRRARWTLSRASTRACPAFRSRARVMKGGSHLCAPNYCQRYRPAARMAQPIDTSTCHVGFRGIVRLDR